MLWCTCIIIPPVCRWHGVLSTEFLIVHVHCCTCIIIPPVCRCHGVYSHHHSSKYKCRVVQYLHHLSTECRCHECTWVITPRSTDVKLYLHYHSLEYRCFGVLIPSFPRMQMPRCSCSRLLMPECICTIVSGRQMPLCTHTIIPQSTNAKLYSTVYLHHHSPECRCYRVKNNHHLGW